MDFTVIIQQDKEGWFLGSIPNIHGCRTQAKTLIQLYKRLEEVALLCLEGQEPEEEVKFIGIQNLKIPVNA